MRPARSLAPRLPPLSSLSTLSWKDLLWRKLWVLWPYKFFGTVVGMTLFFVVYFHVLNHPIRPVTVMPLTRVDPWFAFSPWWLAPYASLWVYVTIPPFLLTDGKELSVYALASVVLSTVGLAIFLVWPTTVPVADIDWTQYPSVSFLKAVDASGNACPSLHVAFAVFAAFCFDHLLVRFRCGAGWRVGNVVWAVAITASTIGTRQHVALDAVGGALLGSLAAIAHRWARTRFVALDAIAGGPPGKQSAA